MVEQWTHKPLDVGSNPTLATFDLMGHILGCGSPRKAGIPFVTNPILAIYDLICIVWPILNAPSLINPIPIFAKSANQSL